MKRANRKCIVCGKEYEFCDSCGSKEITRDQMWKALYHDKNCQHIYEALSAYLVGTKSNDEVIEMMSKCNFDGIELNPALHKAYEEIMELATAPKTEEPKEEINENTEEVKGQVSDEEDTEGKETEDEVQTDSTSKEENKGVSGLYNNAFFTRVR